MPYRACYCRFVTVPWVLHPEPGPSRDGTDRNGYYVARESDATSCLATHYFELADLAEGPMSSVEYAEFLKVNANPGQRGF